MLQLQINSPEIQNIFETRFHSNQEKFMEFIVAFIQDNKKVVDNYFHKKLNPMENYYTLSVDENEVEMTKPFKDVKDSVAFAKKLREESYI